MSGYYMAWPKEERQEDTMGGKLTRRPYEPGLRDVELHRFRRTHSHVDFLVAVPYVIPIRTLAPWRFILLPSPSRRSQHAHARDPPSPGRGVEDFGV